MTASPSPFEVAKQISNNLGQSVERQGDISALDKILSNVSAEGTDEELNNAMAQIVQRVSPARQKAAVGVLQDRKNQITKKKRGQALKELGLPESAADLPDSVLAATIRNQGKVAPETTEQKEEARQGVRQKFKDVDTRRKFEGALDTVQNAQSLLQKKSIGPKFSALGTARDFKSTFTSEGQEDRSKFQSLKLALIQFASDITIRNMKEFVALSKALTNEGSTREELKGTLEAFEDRLRKRIELLKTAKKSGLSEDEFLDLEEQQNRQQERGFASLPPPEDEAGQTFTDGETGQKFKSDGVKWERVK